MLRFAHELTNRLGGAVKDMIPPEAQWHLLNAQRELLTAVFLIYEHQAAARRSGQGAASPPAWDDEYEPAPRPRRRAPAAAPKRPASRTRKAASPRLSKIDIE